MAFVGNLLWFVFGGWIAMLAWAFYALLFACTIIGIPFAVACLRIARFAAFPFGKDIIDAELLGEKRITGTTLFNLIWIVFAGIWLAIGHAMLALFFFITIIGIPWGIAHGRLCKVSFAPLGKRIVSLELAEAAKAQGASQDLNKRLEHRN